MGNPLFATKSVDDLRADAEHGGGFKRSLGALDLTLLGVGCIIGTGIFVLTGRAAAANAGPAVAISFIIAGFASSLAALCYSEMASMIPVSGSAYTYSYATMGEMIAWIIGWDLILEYLVGAATVSVGWSGYVTAFLHNALGYTMPFEWCNAPVTWHESTHTFGATGAYMNVPAMVVVIAVSGILILGIRESARFNAVIVFMKVAVVLAFVAFGAAFVNKGNWTPFIPPNTGEFGRFGISGIFQGATMVFFSYIGFDAVSTAAQETRNPQRDLPIGILASLSICTVLYIVVSMILTGLVPYTQLSVPHPIAVGVEATGIKWLATAVEIGAIAGLSSVMLVLLMAQPRIFFSMANDGLFPKIATRVHPQVWHAAHHHHHHRHRLCDSWRLVAHRDIRGTHQHRHLVCLCAREPRDHDFAGEAPRFATWFQGARRQLFYSDPVDVRIRPADVYGDHGYDLASVRLDGSGNGLLLLLWAQTFKVAPGATCR